MKFMRHIPDGFVVAYTAALEGNDKFEVFETDDSPHDEAYLSNADLGLPEPTVPETVPEVPVEPEVQAEPEQPKATKAKK